MVSMRYAFVAVHIALARGSSDLSRASAQRADTKGGLSKCLGMSGSATLNRMQCQAPFSSIVDSRKASPRRIPSLAASASASEPAPPLRTSPRFGAGERRGGAGSWRVLRRYSSDALPVLAASPLGLAEPVPRRKHHMCRAIGLLVYVNLMVFRQRHAEFLLDGFPGVPEKTFAKVAVLVGSRYEGVRVNRSVHRCLRRGIRIRQPVNKPPRHSSGECIRPRRLAALGARVGLSTDC